MLRDDILSWHESKNEHDGEDSEYDQEEDPESDIERKFYESQLKPKTAEEQRIADEKEAERQKKLQISQAQKDVYEEKCDTCHKRNTLVIKDHEGT